MTNKEFAFNYAGDEFMLYGDIVILVGYDSEDTSQVIVSPTEEYGGIPWYREFLDSTDVITYVTDIRKYQYADLNELTPIHKEEPRPTPEVKSKTPGECIACYEGQQGMDYSAVYKRPGGALKLISWGDGDNNVNEKVWG